jgi:hypothetical protein
MFMVEETLSIKLCKDCVYFGGWLLGYGGPCCKHFMSYYDTNLVSGEKSYNRCAYMRRSSCGGDGKFFEQKQIDKNKSKIKMVNFFRCFFKK